MEHYQGYSFPSPLSTILPPKKQRFLRNRGHDFIFPAVKTDLLLIGVFLILFNCT